MNKIANLYLNKKTNLFIIIINKRMILWLIKIQITINIFLGLLQDVDEPTILNPDLNGKNTLKLNNTELKIKNNEIKEFCKINSISENVLFLSCVSLALNNFNFSDENLIFHGNNIIFTTHFENRKTSIKDYLFEIKKDWEENLKYAGFSTDDVIDEYGLKTEFYYSFNEELDLNS